VYTHREYLYDITGRSHHGSDGFLPRGDKTLRFAAESNELREVGVWSRRVWVWYENVHVNDEDIGAMIEFVDRAIELVWLVV
jgi:hypothetical protein